MIGFRFAFLLISVLVMSLTARSEAEELQITDYFGLVRAQRNVAQKVAVRITVLRNPRVAFDTTDEKPLLNQRTGFAGDIEAVASGPNTYIFPGVSPGVWRIRLRNRAILLDGVEILDGEVRPPAGQGLSGESGSLVEGAK